MQVQYIYKRLMQGNSQDRARTKTTFRPGSFTLIEIVFFPFKFIQTCRPFIQDRVGHFGHRAMNSDKKDIFGQGHILGQKGHFCQGHQLGQERHLGHAGPSTRDKNDIDLANLIVQGENPDIDNVDDLKEFRRTHESFRLLGFSETDTNNIYR